MRSSWLGSSPPAIGFTHDPLRDLDACLARPPAGISGWAIAISYDLGRVIERAAASSRSLAAPTDWPLIELHAICDEPSPALARANSLNLAASLTSHTGRAAFVRDVARVVEYIRAGDIFQANLAHALSIDARAHSAAAIFAALVAAAEPRYGCLFELAGSPGRAILSASPELFLHYDASTRRLVTRPMKGTRSAAGDPAELDMAPKDRAELNMIIDLMRNDLGRVCTLGSIRVEHPRTIERHGGPASGVLQATGTIAGTLRPAAMLGDILRATFPPGSVTGAPKIRAMQIIDELEPLRRGPYCGALGWIGLDGSFTLSVAIRTATLDAGRLVYPVGAGIVADSDPEREWDETLVKAAVLRQALGGRHR